MWQKQGGRSRTEHEVVHVVLYGPHVDDLLAQAINEREVWLCRIGLRGDGRRQRLDARLEGRVVVADELIDSHRPGRL